MTGSWLDVPIAVGLITLAALASLALVAVAVAALGYDRHQRRRVARCCQRPGCREVATWVTLDWETCTAHLPQVEEATQLSDLRQWDADQRREAGT